MPLNQYDDELGQLDAAPPNPYEATLRTLEQADEETLRTHVSQAASTSPDQAAETERLSQQTGLPAGVVERNLEDIRKRSTVAATPYAAMLKESPVLASWLKERPQHAAIAKDDLEQLGTLEWLLTAPQRAYRQGSAQVEFGRLRSESIFRDLTAAEHTRLEELRGEMDAGGALGASQSWFRGAVTGTASQLPNLFGGLLVGARRGVPAGVTAGTAAALAGQLGPQVALPEELLTVPGMFAAGMTAGTLAGGAEFSSQIEAGNAYEEYLGFRDEVGRPIDPMVAKAAAIATGAVNGGLEIFGLEKLFRSLPGANKLPGLFTRGAVKQALRNPTIRAALGDAVKLYGGTLTAETAVEVAQRAVTILAGEIGKAAAKPAPVPGQLEAGNVNLYEQPRVANEDGSVSTVDSVSVNVDGREVLLPTVTPDGQHFSGTPGEVTDAALEEYRRTGRHLGAFESVEAANAFAAQLHHDYASGVYDQAGYQRRPGEMLGDLATEGAGAVQSFALMLLPGPMMSAAGGSYRARQAQHNVTFFKALGEGVTQSKTAQRLPSALQEVLERATKDGPVETVYAPLETWTEYWQSKGVDPGEIAAKVTGDPQAWEHATQTGEDLAIPTARYAVNLAATEHNTFFAQELRLAPNEMNAREGKAFLEEQAAAPAEGESNLDPTSPVREAILQQLAGAGVEPAIAENYATLYEQTFGTLGARAGVDPLELFKRYGLNVTREDLPASINIDTGAAATGEIPASVAKAGETATQRTARTTAHTAALVSSVTRDALQLDPSVDPNVIKRELEWRLAAFEEGQRAQAESGTDSGDLLATVAKYGGVWWETRTGGFKGEIEHLAESRDTKGVKAGTGRVIHKGGRATWKGIAGVFNPEGKTPDGMVEALREDPRFQHIETINDLIDALDAALSTGATQVDATRLPGSADLGELGVELGARWWENGTPTKPAPGEAGPNGERAVFAYFWDPEEAGAEPFPQYHIIGGPSDGSTVSADRLVEMGIPVPETPDSVEAGAGDTSFDVTEFNQGPIAREARRELLEDRINKARADEREDLAAIQQLQQLRDEEEGAPGAAAPAAAELQLPAEFQPDDRTELAQDKRGAIRFGADRQFQIELLRNADLSTFLHETGHFYLEVLGDLVDAVGAADPATLSDEQRGLLADYGAILAFVGVQNRAEISVEQHEQFARAFEAYLFEGKAPSVELRHAFARFRAWLVGVYRSIKGLDVELTDQVRGVFDRLLATDDAIAAAQQEAQIAPLFLDAAAAGMTELEFASYQDQVRQASERAREELQARVLRDLKREELAWWKEEREAIRADVEREVGQRPLYRALSVMRTGVLPDGSPIVEGQPPVPIKLSRDSLVAQFGREILKRLPRPYVYAAASGIAADTAAEIFGYSSGDELIQALVEARPFRQVVELEVDARMFAKHGDVMRDGRLEDLARATVEGEHRQTVVQAELKALTKGMVAATIPSADVINAAAQRRIAATRIRDIRPGTHLMAARRAGQQAFNLLASGQDRAGAVRAKLQELLNLALYREARDAKEHVESMRGTLQAFGTTRARQRFGKAGADHLEQIDSFLDRYELARVPLGALDRRQSLRAWAEAKEAEGLPVEIPAELLDDARRVNYQDITLEEFTGVYEAVEQIAHLARLKNELLKAAKRRTFEEARDTLVGSIQLHNDPRKLPLEFRPGDEKWRRVGDWFASHSKIGILARALDGHEDGGEMWEQIIRPINAAADDEQARNEKAGAEFRAILERAYPGRELAALDRKSFIPAIGDSLSKEGRLAVALNWGNEQNRQRLLADPTRGWNESQIQSILETLDERDWRFVQDVWNFINTFWPEIEAKQKRVTGLAPAKVQPAPFSVTPKGASQPINLAGGYYPLQYDGRLVARAGVLQQTGEAGLAAQAAYVKATTRRGHTETRADKVKLSVRLDFGVVGQHLQNVIHDLTHHEVLLDVNRLIGDQDVQAAILETKGDHVYRQFVNALDDIAKGSNAGAGKATIIDAAATWMRTRTQLAMMGWNLWTALQQPFGLFNGMQRVGPVWVLKGVKRWLRDAATMENTARWIYDVSPFMKSRGSTATQDLADVRAELAKPGGWFDRLLRTTTFDTVTKQNFVDSYLWHIGQAQRVADIPTWLGGYEKAMAGGEEEARAIALADQAVIDSQGSGHIKDLSQVQRGSAIAKLLLTFYSYGNTVFNSTADAYGAADFRKVGSTLQFLGNLGLLYAMPAVATVTLSRALGRSGDDESWFAEFAREMLASALNTMVLAREFTGLLNDGVRGYAGPAGMRAVQSVYEFSAQVRQGEADRAAVKAGTTLGGILFGFPAAQVQRSVDGFVALREGRTKNPLALLVGAPRK